jgi:UDP-glucose:(heptosyl)LPS alpha-1,3-glucosyltransferase
MYNLADLVVLPSRVDHFPLVMLEALASGVPFLATPVGGMGHIVESIDSRLILHAGSALEIAKGIERVLSLSQGEEKKIYINAIKLASKYSWKYISNRILAVLRNLNNNRSNEGVRKI